MTASLASVFELLFKYRPVVFERGTLVFDAGWPTWVAIALVLLLAVPALIGTIRLRAGVRRRDRVVLAVLRGAAILILLVCLARPALLLSASAPQRNVVAVLLDDSRSMRIADVGGDTRGAAVQRTFAANSPLMRSLGERFAVRTYRFAGDAARVPDASALAFDGGRSSLQAAVRQVRQELAGVPLAGIIVVTDGADNADSTIGGGRGVLVGGARVPVYTVGVGEDEQKLDVELTRVEAPHAVLAGGTMVVEATLVQHGLAREEAQLVVESEGRMLATQTVVLPADGVRSTVSVPVAVDEAGSRRLTMRVVPHAREQLTENNGRDLMVDVRDGRDRILYVEGEPRFEFKFARLAVADDDHLQLVALQRTAENKFLRLDVSDSLELLGGFPTTKEALFGYRAVILGSIEASHFTAAQLRLLTDYVGERGGALLFLGGRRSFGEGGYAGTSLAEVMPVLFDDRRDSGEPEVVELTVTPTTAGRVHPVAQMASTADSSQARWSTLPPLTSVNRLRGVKPGATVLLSGDTGADAVPVLAWQRYGRGVAAALAVQDSWMWQMHADIAVDDQTHERFWRQLLRWLSSDVTSRATLVASADRVEAGDGPVTLSASVRDSAYVGVNDAVVSAVILAPSGAEQTVQMAWTGGENGEYRGAFSPSEDGAHQVRLLADAGDGEQLEARTTVVRASDGAQEFFDAGRREPLMRRMAEESGGRYYRLANVGALSREIMYTDSGNTVVERKDLWDMPVILLILVGLLTAEWAYRRMRGAV